MGGETVKVLREQNVLCTMIYHCLLWSVKQKPRAVEECAFVEDFAGSYFTCPARNTSRSLTLAADFVEVRLSYSLSLMESDNLNYS
jgi:hypothetical protein